MLIATMLMGTHSTKKVSQVDMSLCQVNQNAKTINIYMMLEHGKSAPTTPETERKISLIGIPKSRHYTVGNQQKMTRLLNEMNDNALLTILSFSESYQSRIRI